MNAEGGGGGAGSSSGGSGSGASATRPQQQQLATSNDARTSQPALHLSSDEVNYLVFRSVTENALVIDPNHKSLRYEPKGLLPGSFVNGAFILLVNRDSAVFH
jgi:hypothetical protein